MEIAQCVKSVQPRNGMNVRNSVFVATGMLHDDSSDIWPEKTWRHLDADKLARLFAVNATGPLLLLKHFHRLMPRDERYDVE